MGGGAQALQDRGVALGWRLLIERPGLFDPSWLVGLVDAALGDPKKSDEARQAAGLECAARKPEQVDLVARFEGLGQKGKSGFDAMTNAEPQRTLQELGFEPLFGVNAGDIVRFLNNAVRVYWSNAAVQFDDIGDDGTVVVIVPCPIQTARYAFHKFPPDTNMLGGRAAAPRAAADRVRNSITNFKLEQLSLKHGNHGRVTPQCETWGR